jgi:hypothetical protein
MTMSWRTVTSTIDLLVRPSVPPPVLDEHARQVQRRRVRRTVTILVAVVALFYLVAFMQIIMMK